MFDYPGRKLRHLKAMGVDFYIRRALSLAVRDEAVAEAEALRPVAPDLASPWLQLQAEVKGCTRCDLHKTRTQTVFGVGDPKADWMLIGEAPGYEEDKKGEPFVGRAGRLLDKMLAAIGFRRQQVYIANVIKCRPPDNRNPRPAEVSACADYLAAQIRFVQPEIILALGGVAANALLETDTAVGRLRGQVHTWAETEIPIVVTYHPAYLLRSPKQKSAAWEDLQLACKVVNREIK